MAHGEIPNRTRNHYIQLTPVEHFLLFSLKILKTNKNTICSKTHYVIQTDFILRVEGKKVNLQSLKSKTLYDSFVSKISSIPAAQKKYNEAFSTHTSQLDWEKIHVTFFGKTDTNAFPFIWQNRLQSIYTRLNASCKRLNGLLIRLKKFVSV